MKEKIKLEDYFDFGKNEPMMRLAYSKEDVDYKIKVIKKMQELGMKVKIDKLGNICATLEGNGKSDKSVIIGSHTDSVKEGGQYDGPVGVISGLKVIEDVVDKVDNGEIDLDCNLKVIVWACEESNRFGKACLGSKWVEGTLKEEDLSIKEILEKKEEEKCTLQEAIEEYKKEIQSYGLEDIEYVDKIISMEEIIKAYEIHIEQYQYLVENNIDIGIVSSITAPYRMAIQIDGKEKVKDVALLVTKLNEKAKEAEKEGRYRATVPIVKIKQEREKEPDFSIEIQLKGESEHSGATPMNRRKDAILAASKFILKLNQAIEDEGYEFKVYFNEIDTKNDSMNKVSDNAKISLGIDTNGLSEDIIMQVLAGVIDEVAKEEGIKSSCKKVKKLLKTTEKEKTENNVKLDIRMQVPTEPEEMFEEISNMIIGIAHETGNSYICRKTDKSKPIKTSTKLEEQVQEVCNQNNITSTIMPSWAGHDVAHMTTLEKILLFIKSTGGSHNPNENTTKEDIEKGIVALKGTVLEDINQVHRAVEEVEYIENHPIEEITDTLKCKTKKEAIRNILFKMVEAKKMGVNLSEDAQTRLKKEIILGRDNNIEK